MTDVDGHPLRPRLERRAVLGALVPAALGMAALVAGVVALVRTDEASSRPGVLLGAGLVLLGAATVRLGRDTTRRGVANDQRSVAAPMLSRRSRRGLLATGAMAALAALVAPVIVLGPGATRERRRTSWQAGARLVTRDGEPVTVETLGVGALTTCWPEGAVAAADSSVVLVRVAPDVLTPAPGREDWAPEGHVAYSKLCTHMGCPVGLFQSDPLVLVCPCHQAIFDVADSARPLGGPASRPLPQLPLDIDDDGVLRARDDFADTVGPGWWDRPA
ncbi:hypothetical protein BH23ACT2_BH23ACT2_19250 [soil metagenome]